MAQQGKKLKAPELGAYRYGTMTGAEFAPSKQYDHPDVKLVGDWEGEGLGYWYANWKAVTALARAGLLQQMPNDGKKFNAVTGHRFCIYRQHGEGDAHDWFVIAYDESGNQVSHGSFPDPVEPQEASNSTQPPPPQQIAGGSAPDAGPASGNPPPPPPTQAGPPGGAPLPTEPTAATLDAVRERAALRNRQMLSGVDSLYGLCLVVAAYQQARHFNVPAKDLDVEGLQAGAATVMIALERLDYDTSIDRRPAYLKRLKRLEHSLFPNECPPLPEDVKAGANGEKEKKGKKQPKAEEPPAPVSTLPGASFAGVPIVPPDEDEDDLPF